MTRSRSFSRYRDVAVREERVRGGGVRNVMEFPQQRDAEAAQFHVVIAGDRLDLLAFRYYGDPTKWWAIADANRELFGADTLPFAILEGHFVGSEIAIPYNPVRP